MGSTPTAAVARGGTVRSPMSCFPSLFAMLKSMPCGAHDADELMRLAFPPSPKDARETLDWSATARPRLAKLRAAARAAAEAEMGPPDPPPVPAAAAAAAAATAAAAEVAAAGRRGGDGSGAAAAAALEAAAAEEEQQRASSPADGHRVTI